MKLKKKKNIKKMPSKPRQYINKSSIVEYWMYKINENELNFKWKDAYNVCWCCGDSVDTEMCHIIPHQFDGKEIPENMVLLCKQCHYDNPNLTSSESYIKWLKSRRKIADMASGYYWQGRALLEYQIIFGSDFIEDLKTTGVDPIIIAIISYNAGKDFTMDPGQYRHNIANLAFRYRETFLKCKDESLRIIETQGEQESDKIEKLEDNELEELKNIIK